MLYYKLQLICIVAFYNIWIAYCEWNAKCQTEYHNVPLALWTLVSVLGYVIWIILAVYCHGKRLFTITVRIYVATMLSIMIYLLILNRAICIRDGNILGINIVFNIIALFVLSMTPTPPTPQPQIPLSETTPLLSVHKV